MMRQTFALLICIGLATSVGCDQLLVPHGSPNKCPQNVKGVPQLDAAEIQWGDTAKITAQITHVAVECVPAVHPGTTVSGVTREGYTDYELAATALVVYQVQDPEFFATATRFKDLEPAVVFEAIAESGVVLGSGMTVFRLANGGASGAASVKITGLSEGALQKLWLVRARWQYGKS